MIINIPPVIAAGLPLVEEKLEIIIQMPKIANAKRKPIIETAK